MIKISVRVEMLTQTRRSQKHLRDLPAQDEEKQVPLIQGNPLLTLMWSLLSRPPVGWQVRRRQLPVIGAAWLRAGGEHTALGGQSGQPRVHLQRSSLLLADLHC